MPPSLELPRPPSDLKAARKGARVTLTWSVPTRTTERQSVRYLGKTHICRSLEPALQRCAAIVAEAPPPGAVNNNAGKKQTGSYVDTLPSELTSAAPYAVATYAVEVLNSAGRSAGLSNQVHAPLAPTPPAPADFSALLTSQGILLTWTGQLRSSTDDKPIRFRYRVYCREETSQQQSMVGVVDAGDSPNLSLTDTRFEWEKTYLFHVEPITLLSQPGKPEIQIEGDNTPEVKIFAHDVFPPAVPSGLEAVFSGPGQQPFIDLVWFPVADSDLAGYNVYRREQGETPVKVNAELEKTPAFRDRSVAPGHTYMYSVTAVDLRGNESARSSEASETVPSMQ